ncbi:AfsR/SARP family transcriptional regulator [Streptomyces bohaiensis]|uniref:AfsR/SARP family transcriptional regulator n=1 Tax=Streptomyces bohaiensis TaxID=1431344 RepID=A0ABX1C8G4_9ACTN|nr:AfsR/SARP family transcriptional regulator [Streptomyces bohaiensis]NJQ13632.1 AfsR/SARP family transcriptional regulator [Streptomyces bohaiensis]
MNREHTAAQETSFRFSIIGGLDLRIDGARPETPTGKQHTLLASLLLHPDRVLSTDELIDYLWEDSLPQHPAAALHTVVTRVRRALCGEARSRDVIRRRGSGYGLASSDCYVDLVEFRSLVRRADTARREGNHGKESQLLGAALALWSWPALPDVGSRTLRRAVLPGLTEEWLASAERRAEVDLALGRPQRLIPELTTLATAFPYHERLWRARILALHHSGRDAEALRVFSEFRDRARAELGAEPGCLLKAAHLAVLRGGTGRPGTTKAQ